MRKSESSDRAPSPAGNIIAREREMEKLVRALTALAEAARALKNVPLRFPRAEELLGRES